MERKKYHKNKLAQKDDYNPFDEMWFWLHLALMPTECTDFMCSQDKGNVKQNHCIDRQNSHSNQNAPYVYDSNHI